MILLKSSTMTIEHPIRKFDARRTMGGAMETFTGETDEATGVAGPGAAGAATAAAGAATRAGTAAAPGAGTAAAPGPATPLSDDVCGLPHPTRDELELAAVLHALSDPMRLRIVAELAASGGERTCKSFNLPIVKSTCTHHFKVLREAGLIRQQVVGTTRVNTLRREDLEVRFPGLLDAVLQGARAA
jgi:DNA-binding transcriptional ArsR family regulator